jgi:hypothetical protein
MEQVHFAAETLATWIIEMLFGIGPKAILGFTVFFVHKLALQNRLACRRSEEALAARGWAAGCVAIVTCWLAGIA